jgi:Pyridoxamine 5'-phosphate oxidase
VEIEDPAGIARAIVDANNYMTLATADADGLPWASPVWFAPSGYREFLWISRPGARHSRNLAVRPELAIVIFDSQLPISTGQALYMAAVAGLVPDEGIDEGMATFSRKSVAVGGHVWTGADVRPPAELRLYRAVASEHFVLTPSDQRVPVTFD